MMDKALLEMTLLLNYLVLVLVFLGSVDAQGGCVPEVQVRKNTVLRVSSKRPLNISCPVRYCEEIPTIRWCRLSASNKSYYIPVNETDQITITQEKSTAHEKEIISYLSFKSISNSDAGLYRCVASVPYFISESHNINIAVSETVLQLNNEITHSPNTIKSDGGWMPYIIICSGIIGLVTVVMVIFFLSVDRCKCSRKGNNHRTQVPPSPNVSKGDGYRRGQEKKSERKNVYKSSSETLQLDIPSSSSARDQQENTPQEQIVYATLEHLTPRDPSAVHHPNREQPSEYAAIKLYSETV